MKRKGELVYDQTVALIVIAAVALILVAWWSFASANIIGDKEVEACRLSVTAYAKSWVEVATVDSHLFEVDCKRRVITFTKDNVEMNGENIAYYNPDAEKSKKGYDKLTASIVNSVAAEELATCWYQFLEGKSYWTDEIDIGNNDKACFVCGEIHFAHGVEYEAKPLIPYLQRAETRKYPLNVPGAQRPTYSRYLFEQSRVCDHGRNKGKLFSWYEDYLKLHPGASCEEAFYDFITREWMYPDTRLNPDKSYRIIFFQHGKDEDKTAEGEPTGTSYAPMIIPAEKLDANLCPTFIG